MHLIQIVGGVVFIHFPSESVPLFQSDFFCCPAETCATEKALSARPNMFREHECSIIYAPLTNFMMPLGGHAAVLCLLLLAVVQRCILMDMSKNEVSLWQCTKKPISQAQRNKGIDGAHLKMMPQSLIGLVCLSPILNVDCFVPAKHFLQLLI